MRIPLIRFIAGLLSLASSAGGAWAAGLGDGSTSTILGRPLEFRAVMRLAPGESLDAECVRATVSIGDNVVPTAGVGTLVTTGPNDSAIIRVRTLARIDEPIVTVSLEAGCNSRLLRRYTVFADPPAADLPVLAVAAAPEVASPAVAAAPALPPVAVRRVPAAPPASSGPGAAEAAPAPKPPKPPKKPRPRARPAAPAEGVATAEAPPRARLRLDAPAEAPPMPSAAVLSAETLALVDQANEAVKAAIGAASASQQRIAALEAGMQQIAEASAQQRALIEQLNARAAAAEGGSRWFWPLALVAAVLATLAAWMWLRLRELERERQMGWQAVARAEVAPPEAAAEVPTPSKVPLLVERGARNAGAGSLGAGLAPQHVPTPSELPPPPPRPRPPAPPALSPEQAMQQTLPLVPGTVPARTGAPAETRDVSAEELIDLEQQAEFFVVLGQDDAAIDLLVSHLRDTGGASPLPYLKLLDIYRRLGDEASYERTRDRFNHRFNAHAPSWETPPAHGRVLEEYPQVIGWIQQVWPRPLDAMAELESLLFRRDEGELFDLPAYRELLMLYGLARDLLDAESGGRAGVDVLLPLNDAAAFAPTSPRPYFGDDVPDHAPEGQATAPLDLDLDPDADEGDSIFDTTRR